MQTNKSNGQLTAQINVDDHKKSGFDLSNNVLGTGKIGRIIPTRALHVMPNDTIKADSKVAVQFEPLAVPILANMDVKQEHFYVPYNIVWKNWDKFISGGEKMDYKGVVPNISMSKCLVALAAIFNNSAGKIMHLPIRKDQTLYLDIQETNVETYANSIKASLDYVGDKFQIKDLLKPCYETLDKIYFELKNDADVTSSTLFYEVTNVKDFDNLDFVNYLTNNKYVKQLIPAYKSQLEAGRSQVFIPNAFAMKYISLMYEFYKPFIGIGSNLDYLNMARITLTDFVYLISNAAYTLDAIMNTTDVYELYPNANDAGKLPMSVLNLRANYNIWFNNYRDILLEADAMEPVDTDEITNDELFILLVPRQRCWEKDAFTTALDNPGTGNVGVPITQAALTSDKVYSNVNPDIYHTYSILKANMLDNSLNSVENATINANNIVEISIDGESWKIPTAYLSGINEIMDVSSSLVGRPGFSLYALDAAQRAQKWLQKALFFGNRISDFYYMHFGVRFLDARLRLPELLTSSSELVKLDVVMNNTNITTEANGEIYQSIAGDRAAYASAYDNGNSFERYCEEHGVIMSYLTIMPQVTYAYGMNRDYSRLDQFDFAFSEFATLGMDAVYDSEITSISVDLPNDAQDVKVFGYQGKYYDYKAKHSEEHGELLDSQDMYTFARKFNMYDPNGRPKLNYEFVHCFPDLDMFVVDSSLSDYFRYDIRHSTAAERNLPSQSIYI